MKPSLIFSLFMIVSLSTAMAQTDGEISSRCMAEVEEQHRSEFDGIRKEYDQKISNLREGPKMRPLSQDDYNRQKADLQQKRNNLIYALEDKYQAECVKRLQASRASSPSIVAEDVGSSTPIFPRSAAPSPGAAN